MNDESVSWSVSAARRIDAVCLRFEAAWREGTRPRIEDHLQDAPERDRPELLRELLGIEVQWRIRRGEIPKPEEYRERFSVAVEELFAQTTTADFSLSTGFSERVAPPGYEILGDLGRGGMGIVYKARQLGLNRLVALKMLLSANHAGEEELARFRAEAEALAALRHPNVVQVYEAGEWSGRPYFSMELVEGGTLAGRMTGEPFASREAAELIETLAGAVQAAHEHGIVHRDLKPANVLMGADAPSGATFPRITDFGLAKFMKRPAGQTRSGAVMGTPAYMAPEQARGDSKNIGPAADVYALGAMLYELLTGRPPFQGESTLGVLLRVLSHEPTPPRRLHSEIPSDIEAICLKCLEKEPHHRYATAAALATDLRNFLRGLPTDRPESAWRRLETELYFKNVALAERAWAAGQPQYVDGYLDACPPDLRGWEWHCVRGLGRGRLLIHRGHKDVVFAVAFSRDGRLLASASDDQTVLLRATDSGEVVKTLGGHSDQLYAIRFSPDNRRLAASSQDRMVRVWDLLTGESVVWTGHTDVVVGVDWSPDGFLVASGSDDSTIRLWDAATGQTIRVLRGHTDMVNGVAFSPNSSLLVSGSYDQTVRLWEVATGRERLRLAGHAGFVWSVAFSPDGSRLASGGGDHTVRLWDTATGQELHTLTGHAGAVWGVAFSPDGRRLASVSWDRTVRIWDPGTGQEAVTLRGHADSVNGLAFDSEGRRLATASDDRTVVVWDAVPAPEGDTAVIGVLRGNGLFVHTVAFSPDGRRLATGGDDRTVRLWSLATGAVERSLHGHTALITGLAFCPDGAWLVSGSADKTLRIWETATGRELGVLRGHTDRVHGVAVDCNGRIASCAWDRTVRVWDAGTKRELRVLHGHTNWVWAVAFSPDGRQLASASTDWTVRLWDADAGTELLGLCGHTLKVQGVAFHPSGALLASAGSDQVVCLWELKTGVCQRRLVGHGGRVYMVAFSPDGRTLASTGEDQTVRLWSVETGEEVRVFRGHTQPVNAVAFSPDGRLLASAAADGTVKLWRAL